MGSVSFTHSTIRSLLLQIILPPLCIVGLSTVYLDDKVVCAFVFDLHSVLTSFRLFY